MAYVERDERLLFVFSGSHVDVDELEVELFLFEANESPHRGRRMHVSVEFQIRHDRAISFQGNSRISAEIRRGEERCGCFIAAAATVLESSLKVEII